MKHLVFKVCQLLIARFRGVNRNVTEGNDNQLPAPAKYNVEGHGVQDGVDDKVIPVCAFSGGDKVALKEIVADHVTRY